MTKRGQLTGRKAMLVIDFLMVTGFAMMAYGMTTMRPGVAPNWGFIFGGLLFFWMAVMELPESTDKEVTPNGVQEAPGSSGRDLHHAAEARGRHEAEVPVIPHGNGSANAGWSGGPSRREYPGLPSLPEPF